ncbi:hypothetical protein HZC30_01205 [Candidatus Woesearchaeota archaeon]|nr:hypothetical protein [Candidatus Woesearchaeota archaeon]
MVNPQFIEQKPLSLGEVKEVLAKIEKRDTQMNFLSNKAKEYVQTFPPLSEKKREELHKKLAELGVTRLKEEVIAKITDFVPKDINELKVITQAYTLTLSKKDQDSIVEVVSKFVKE